MDDDVTEEFNGIAYRDILMNTILGLVCIVGIVVLLISVKQKLADQQAQPPGNLMVHIVWSPDDDVDLWLDGPDEPRPIGYSNKGGALWNLLRDDLGYASPLKIHFEDAYTRGIKAGEYRINVMCYRCSTVPVEVKVEVSLNPGTNGKEPLKTLVTTSVVLSEQGQEKTAIDFVLNEDKEIAPGSENNVFQQLRSAESTSEHATGGSY